MLAPAKKKKILLKPQPIGESARFIDQRAFACDNKAGLRHGFSHTASGAQKHRVIFNGVAKICDYSDKAEVRRLRQSEQSKPFLTAELRVRSDSLAVKPVVNDGYLISTDALYDKLIADRFCVCDDRVSHAIGGSLNDLLCGSSPPVRLSPRRNARGHAGQATGSHAKEIGIKIVRLNDIDLALAQQAGKAAKLRDGVAIIKAGKPKFWNLSDCKPLDFGAQLACRIQASDIYLISPAIVQEARELDCLKLRPALMKAPD